MKLRGRTTLVLLAIATVGIGVPARAQPSVCIWGGTPASPTGQFHFADPGLKVQPSTEDIPFKAWGPAEGPGCNKTVVFEGVAVAGASCGAIIFQGRVRGVKGVATFYGGGPSVLAHEFLYDKKGNVVGLDDPTGINPQLVEFVVNDAADDGQLVCGSSGRGFTDGYFSSVITLFS
jgi:hypothetical protein